MHIGACIYCTPKYIYIYISVCVKRVRKICDLSFMYSYQKPTKTEMDSVMSELILETVN